MEEPSRRTSRLTIAGVTLALIGVGTAGFVLGRSTIQAPPKPPATTVPRPTPTPAPVLPAVQPPLGRAELIEAASSAADAFAAGRPLPETVARLAGRDFELRLPFGCPGAPQSGAGALSVEYDEAAEALRVRAEPVRWPPQEWLPSSENMPEAAPTMESIEGFWISSPWTSSESCPPAGAVPVNAQELPAAVEQTLGIAQFSTPDDSRVGRRNGKAYESVESVTPEALDLSQGLRLRLRGKLARGQGPGTGPVICRAPMGTRPVCVLSATFDEVAIENAATGATLATWDVSSQARKPADR